MKTLKQIFNSVNRRVDKWTHYFDIYESHFEPLRDEKMNILEIGVAGGGSLQMWKEYFPNSQIYGIDIDISCYFQEDRIKVFIGSQRDRTFLQNVINEIGRVDILIDDGSHLAKDQIATFETIFYYVDRYYVVEDLHTSYYGNYKGSFIKHSHRFIDWLHAYHTKKPVMFAKNVKSLTYYDSILVIEKGNTVKPEHIVSGEIL